MAGAAKAATVPLQRRLIGSLLVFAGIALVLLGFFADLNGNEPGQVAIPATTLTKDQEIPLRLFGGLTPADILRHAADHRVPPGTLANRAADVGLRSGVGLMALGAALALFFAMAVRSLVGLACGLGLLGVLMVAGIVIGRGTQISDLTSGSFRITVGGGLMLAAGGFVAAMVGGALAATRPLAGLATGVGLTVVGVVTGTIFAVAVGGARLAGV